MVKNNLKDHKIIIVGAGHMAAALPALKSIIQAAAKAELISLKNELINESDNEFIDKLICPIKRTDTEILKLGEALNDLKIEKSDNDFLNKKQKFQRRKAIKKLK